MRRIDGKRREQGKDLPQEIILEPASSPSWSPPVRRPARCPARPASAEARASASADRLPAPPTASPMRLSCSAGVSPSGLLIVMPARSWPLRPATRTMKNSSRLLAEIDRNRTRSSSGWASLAASSSTRRLKCSHDSSRLMKRSGARDQIERGTRPWSEPAGATGSPSTTMSLASISHGPNAFC